MLKLLITPLPMIVCALLSAELFLSMQRFHDTARRWLTLWAMVTMLLYAGHLVFFLSLKTWIPLSDTIYVGANLSVYPLYLIYIYRLTQPIVPKWALSLLAVPIAAMFASTILYLIMGAEERTAFIDVYLYQTSVTEMEGMAAVQAIVHTLYKVLFAAEVIVVMIAGSRQINRYDRMVNSLYADTEGKTLAPIRNMMMLLIVMSLLSFLTNAIGRALFIDSDLLRTGWALLFSILLFAIGWTGLCQEFTIDDINKFYQTDNTEFSEESHETLPTPSDSIQQLLEQLMQEEQLYLQHDLKLDQVARRLGTNRTYLLRVLKDEMNMSFTEYINRQRIAYAKNLEQTDSSLSKANIALRSGYASLSSFYRNYRLYSAE